MNDWLFHRSEISGRERASVTLLRQAFDASRKGRSVTSWDRQLLAGRGDAAVNPLARIEFGRALCRALSQHFNLGPAHPHPDQPLFLVTLCDRECSTTHDADFVNVAGFIKRLRKGANGLSYIGMLEPAYYANITQGSFYQGKRGVFWHLHLVCWGETANQIDARLRRLNAGNVYRKIADGLPAVHKKRIVRSILPRMMWYLVKTPKDAYRIHKVSKDRVTEDGEVIGRFGQKSSKLRAGDRVTLFKQLRHVPLHDLAVAGGEGVGILQRAKRIYRSDCRGGSQRSGDRASRRRLRPKTPRRSPL